MPAARHATPILAKNACDAVTSQAFCHGISVWMPTKPGPHKVGRRGCAVTSILRSKILAQGQFTCPEHVRFPWGGATTGSGTPKIRPSAKGRWSYFWCGHGDSNPNAVKHENLNLACLPISSCPHSNAILPQPRAGSKQKIAVRFLKAAETRKRRIFYFVLRLHNERETHGANPVSPAFLIRFRRAAAPPSGAAFFRRTSASRCRTRRGWSGATSE